jgi:flagellar biosynthesis/type III secretory pathway protein FliH
MYVLEIAQQVIADRSDEEVELALAMLRAELDQFMKAHAVAIQ